MFIVINLSYLAGMVDKTREHVLAFHQCSNWPASLEPHFGGGGWGASGGAYDLEIRTRRRFFNNAPTNEVSSSNA